MAHQPVFSNSAPLLGTILFSLLNPAFSQVRKVRFSPSQKYDEDQPPGGFMIAFPAYYPK